MIFRTKAPQLEIFVVYFICGIFVRIKMASNEEIKFVHIIS